MVIDIFYSGVGILLTIIFCKKRFINSALTISYESNSNKIYEITMLYWTTLMWVSNNTKTKIVDGTNTHRGLFEN